MSNPIPDEIIRETVREIIEGKQLSFMSDVDWIGCLVFNSDGKSVTLRIGETAISSERVQFEPERMRMIGQVLIAMADEIEGKP